MHVKFTANLCSVAETGGGRHVWRQTLKHPAKEDILGLKSQEYWLEILPNSEHLYSFECA